MVRPDAESVGVHAYVLMTNHAHLLRTAETAAGVPQMMKRLGQRYVQHINRSYRRTCGLFEGCFRSSLIEADGYLLACQRYSHARVPKLVTERLATAEARSSACGKSQVRQ